MVARNFIDTGLLLRAVFDKMDRHEICREILDRLIYEEEEGQIELWISGQVVREFLFRATSSRTLANPLQSIAALDKFEFTLPIFRIAEETEEVHALYRQLVREYQVKRSALHDTNIVATMLVHGIETIHSLDGDFVKFNNLITVLSD